MKSVYKSASGSVILAGEYAVLYGQPGLASSVSAQMKGKLCRVQNATRTSYFTHICNVFCEYYEIPALDLQDFSVKLVENVPEPGGIGSSAAYAYVCVQLLADYFDVQLTSQAAFELVKLSEDFIHGTSSGIGPFCTTHSGLWLFQKKNQSYTTTNVSTGKPLSTLLLFTGSPKESTGEMVQMVKEKVAVGKISASIFPTIGEIVGEIVVQVKLGEVSADLLSLVCKNHAALDSLGVVGHKASAIISFVEKQAGAAKISGAGGSKNGSGVVLAFHEDLDFLQSKLAQFDVQIKKVELG